MTTIQLLQKTKAAWPALSAAPAEEKTPHAEPPQPLEMEEPKPEENDPFEDIFKIFQNRD